MLRQEAELLRAIAVEKGVIHHRLSEGAWERVSRALNIPISTCKYVCLQNILPDVLPY